MLGVFLKGSDRLDTYLSLCIAMRKDPPTNVAALGKSKKTSG